MKTILQRMVPFQQFQQLLLPISSYSSIVLYMNLLYSIYTAVQEFLLLSLQNVNQIISPLGLMSGMVDNLVTHNLVWHDLGMEVRVGDRWSSNGL